MCTFDRTHSLPMPPAPKPTRRWFQFGITSLFLLTALVAIWLAWELPYIRQRQAWVRENPARLEPNQNEPPRVARIPWWRTMLGDEPVTWISSDYWSDDERATVSTLFPEASLWTLPRVLAPVTFTGTMVVGPVNEDEPAKQPPDAQGKNRERRGLVFPPR
jgi:hypothetical protein